MAYKLNAAIMNQIVSKRSGGWWWREVVLCWLSLPLKGWSLPHVIYYLQLQHWRRITILCSIY